MFSMTLGTFESEDEDDVDHEFSVLSVRIMFGGRDFSKCAWVQTISDDILQFNSY